MNNWLPVIATLSGAIVAGAISVLVHWLSNRHSLRHTKILLAEERAKWAIEKRLDRLQNFFGTLEKLFKATSEFRIQQAWEATAKSDPTTKIPKWVASYDKARGGFEDMLTEIARELLLLDEEVQLEYEKADISWFRWMKSKTENESAETLYKMEADIQQFRKWVAKRYRTQFEDRFKGADHAI